MSALPLVQTGGVYTYDFTNAMNKAHGEASGFKEIGSAVFGMVGGDANADGQLNETDLIGDWKLAAGLKSYLSADFNLNSQIDNIDKNDNWHPNYQVGYETQVPE
jgi:hypothetical protein